MIRLLRRTFTDWLDDDCPRMAAALSYYTVFSLPPLLVLILMLVGVFVEPGAVEGRIFSEISELVGPAAAEQVRGMVENVTRPGSGGPLVVTLGILGLLLGATGVLGQLQAALNRAWEVEPDPERGGWKNVIRKRILSLGMILTLAFLLLVSLVASAAVGAFGEALAGYLPGGLSGAFLTGVDLALSLAVATLLFAAIFVVLPDARVAWKDVWVGALGTAVLFTAGRFLLGLWLTRSDPGAAYGAAGSLALILVWIYYSAMIFFLGAEFTQAWAAERGSGIQPDEGAVRVVTERHHVRPGEGEAAAGA